MGSEGSPGIVPRTCQDLFQRIDELLSANISCTVRISYFEVYNEQVRDLLKKRNDNVKLKVRESPTEGPYIEDLSEYTVKDVNQVLKYLKEGNKARATASTKMNDMSSRSHAVFTLVLKQVHFDENNDTTQEKISRIRLVDLAGSERANSSGATGERLREGSNINKSLTTLGRVISSLANSNNKSNKQPQQKIIPYRDSILTWLLKDSLGGNSKTAMVACISPTDYDETLSTLRYADQAKQVKTRAVINQDIVSKAQHDKMVEEMQDRINTLQLSLMQYSQSQEDEFKQQLEKVKHTIRYYEERAINEENKRKAIQAESLAIARHNRLLTDHLKEVTNKSMIGLTSELTYDSLKQELNGLANDFGCFKSKLNQSYLKSRNSSAVQVV